MTSVQFRWNGISERDMDLLFLEEFALNKDFVSLFLQKTGNTELFSYKIISEEISLTDAALGESDLTIVLEKDGHKVALLVEDKIHATAQPRQYERYVERGEKGVREKIYDAFYIFLIAPEEYIKNNSSAAKYPLKVTYEECQKLFAEPITVRNQLRYQQFSEAIKQAHRPYNKIVDTVSTVFWSKYVCYLHTHYPNIELRSKVKEKSKNGDWPTYKTSLDLKPVYIHHKMNMRGVEYSYIDLTFNGLAAHREELKGLLKDMLREQYIPQFGIHKAGNSAVLRLVAPKCLDWQIPFEEQIATVEEHLYLVSLMCETAKRIDRERLIALYEEAAPEKIR